MPSIVSWAASPGAPGATTATSTSTSRRAVARRNTNAPGVSPGARGNECVRKSTFICSVFFHAIGGQLVELAPDLAELGALAGDLLANETRGEEDAPQHQARCDDRPYRAVADPGGEE